MTTIPEPVSAPNHYIVLCAISLVIFIIIFISKKIRGDKTMSYRFSNSNKKYLVSLNQWGFLNIGTSLLWMCLL